MIIIVEENKHWKGIPPQNPDPRGPPASRAPIFQAEDAFFIKSNLRSFKKSKSLKAALFSWETPALPATPLDINT